MTEVKVNKLVGHKGTITIEEHNAVVQQDGLPNKIISLRDVPEYIQRLEVYTNGNNSLVIRA